MLEKKFIVTSPTGIHARPATELVREAGKFISTIKVTARDLTIDMKSIMGLMSLGMFNGQEFTLTIEGEDEDLAMESLTKYFIEKGLAKVNE